MVESRSLLWIRRTFAVLLCAVPDGRTRIAINDLVTFDR
jgi:hypothetical protein